MRHTAVRDTSKKRDLGGLGETQSSSNSEQSSTKSIQITSKASRSRLNALSEMPEEIDRAIKSLLSDYQESEALENTSDHLAGEVFPIFHSKEKVLPCTK